MERLQRLRPGGIVSMALREMIASGIVKVNGKVVTELGTKVDP